MAGNKAPKKHLTWPINRRKPAAAAYGIWEYKLDAFHLRCATQPHQEPQQRSTARVGYVAVNSLSLVGTLVSEEDRNVNENSIRRSRTPPTTVCSLHWIDELRQTCSFMPSSHEGVLQPCTIKGLHKMCTISISLGDVLTQSITKSAKA